jgi:hypothetical protein
VTAPALQLPWPTGQTHYIWYGANSYGCNDHTGRDANAIDFQLSTNDAVSAVAAGTAHIGPYQANGYGNFVWIAHGNGVVSLYGHLNSFAVSDGQTVGQGQVIGAAGSTGNSTGTHLHFSLRQGATGWTDGSALAPEPMSGYTGFGNYGTCNNNGNSPNYTSSPPNTGSQSPSAPTNLSSSVSGSSVTVRWTDTSSNESGFYIYRWNGSAWVQIATVGANSTAYTDNGLGAGTWYHTVCSYNGAGGNCASTYTTSQVGSSRSEVVVDQTDSGFSRNGCPYWYTASYGYGGSTLWTYVNGSTVSCSATWSASLGGGNYEVYVFVPRSNATTRNARYNINTSSGTIVRSVNQNAYYDAWVSLGTYSFGSGTAQRVSLADNTGEAPSTYYQIAFDAIRLTPR